VNRAGNEEIKTSTRNILHFHNIWLTFDGLHFNLNLNEIVIHQNRWKKKPSMISFEEALRVITSSKIPLTGEEIPLVMALNRVLGQDLLSDVDMPPYDKSAMDGFACRKADLDKELMIVEEIPAGKVPVKSIETGECARIMTGAMIPDGADYVLMKEHAAKLSYNSVKCSRFSENTNICYRGEDVKSGDLILGAGTRLLPAQLAIMAAAGCIRPYVFSVPKIAVISTGNELVEPDKKPGSGKIRNSNGIQLTTQTMHYGLHADYLGIVPDNREKLTEVLTSSLKKYQVILISGGVSVGDYDFVPAVLQQLNVDIMIHGMNVKPGKHLLFGKRENHFVLGLPGNPVSSFVLFEMLVKPLLNSLMGSTEVPLMLSVPLALTYSRTKDDTLLFIPVSLTHGTALPLEYHGSAHINAYARAEGIMQVPIGVRLIKEGDIVHVRPV
jgi:molybdopterin molybdotransferase